MRFTGVIAGWLICAAPALAASQSLHVPLVSELVMVSVTHAADGDRENVVMVKEVTPRGVRYAWHLDEPAPGGGRRRLEFGRVVGAADLSGAASLHTVFASTDWGAKPGTTSIVLSRAVYDKLVNEGSAPLAMTLIDGDTGAPVTVPGTAELMTSDPVPFPVLLNGERVSLPTLQVNVTSRGDGKLYLNDFLILQDRDHPLILRNDRSGGNRMQMVRIDFPAAAAAAPARLQDALADGCRAELPGVYFAFGSAELDERSHRALTELGVILVRHPDWVVRVEGHTDDIGSPASNQSLSAARAAAVRDGLVRQHGIPAARITTQGFGASRPRESNATLEGRARNRRVELARTCPQ